MKWEGNRQSDNVEDRRGQGGGGFGGMLGGRSIGIGTIVLALVGSMIFGVNPLTIINVLSGMGGSAPVTQSAPAPAPPKEDPVAAFVSTVLADTEDVWTDLFRQSGASYVKPKLVLYSGRTATACGTGQAAMGPFYCPGDQKVYLDLDFFNTLKRDLGASGEFAEAYVIAHEVGHHVQNLMGVTGQMDRMRGRVSEREYNALSVRLELQADCFAGIWAHHNHQSKAILEPGDIEEALNAAAAIGDDTLQRKSQGTVVPDSFTHGTSEQRQRWFHTGLKTGNVQACDTFNARTL